MGRLGTESLNLLSSQYGSRVAFDKMRDASSDEG